jgi:hypothetical protein
MFISRRPWTLGRPNGSELGEVTEISRIRSVTREAECLHSCRLFAGCGVDISPLKTDRRANGIYGHSQGGMIAPLVASRSPDVAFVISGAGHAVPLYEGEINSIANQVRARGVTGSDLERGYGIHQDVGECCTNRTRMGTVRCRDSEGTGQALVPRHFAFQPKTTGVGRSSSASTNIMRRIIGRKFLSPSL